MKRSGYFLAPAAALAVILWGSCSTGPTASKGTGTETGNAFNGRVLYQDGSPAAGVTVRILPVNFVPLAVPPDSEIMRTTDPDGYYYYGDLGNGRYNAECLKDSVGVFLDSIVVNRDESLCRVPVGTMDRLGVIKGATRLFGSDNPDSLRVFIYFPGTRHLLKPVIGEGFVFNGMAPGPYHIVFDPTLINYIQQELDTVLAPGDTLVLDTIVLSPYQN